MALFGKQFIKQKSLATNKIMQKKKAIIFCFAKVCKYEGGIKSKNHKKHLQVKFITHKFCWKINFNEKVETLICRVTAEVEVAGGLQAEVSAVPFPPKLLICKQW